MQETAAAVRRCNQTNMLALSVSEIDAAAEAGVSLRPLFRNEWWGWQRVLDVIERRRVNRESVRLSDDRTGRRRSPSERNAEAAASAELLAAVNRRVLDAIEAADERSRAAGTELVAA
jgi:hypothetical protein